MNHQSDRLYRYSVWSLAVALISSGAALMIVMMANVIGPFQFTAIDPDPLRRGVGFWIPSDGERPYPPEVARRTEAWRRLLDDDEILIESDRLEDLVDAGVATVVLTDARHLSRAQAEAADRYVNDGGGIVMSGSIGVRDESDQWIGYDVMRELLRVPSVAPLPRELSEVLAANRRGPISARLRPGHRFNLMGEPGVPALETNESELLWAGAADADAVHTGASRRLRLGRGRLAWVAPGPEVISEADTSDVRALHRSLRNAMAWVRMHAVVEMRAWPGAAPFALEIAERDAGSRAPATADERGSFEAAVLTAMRNAQTSGVFLLVEIPRNGDEDAWADALRRRLVAEAEARGAWLTSRHAASRWMVVRGDLRLAVTEAGPSRLLVNVTNPTEAAIDGLGLKLWINRPAGDIRVDAVALGQALPTVRFDRGSESAEFDLPSLSPRATLSFHVDLEEPPSDEASDLRSG